MASLGKRKIAPRCTQALLVALPVLCSVAGVALGAAIGSDQNYEYRVSWNGIPAARVTIGLTNQATAAPVTTRVRVEMRTNRFIDLFWSLRAESSAEVDAVALRPQHFTYDRRINGRRELTSIDAEPDGELTGRYARPGRYHLMTINNPVALDPITGVLRALRELPVTGQPQTYEIFTGESRYRIELHRQGSETINVPAGRFAAVRLEPAIWRLDRNARDARVRHLTLWVAEAPPHTLLRVRSEVFIGAVYCELTNVSGGESTSP